MPFGFFNTAMLIGLAAVAIPILIHLLNRRRYEVVDWGAMQFLHISETTRRRLLIEEIILMLLRMGLIAIMVLALAAPWAANSMLAKLGGKTNRDVVLIFDGSYSMGFTPSPRPLPLGERENRTPHDAAKEWASKYTEGLSPQDGVAILQAKQLVMPILGDLTLNPDRVKEAIQKLPGPRGGVDWPQAVQAAQKILAQSKRPERDIIILTDGQRFGWSDDNSLVHWELLANNLKEERGVRPEIRVINFDPDRPADPPNWSLLPLKASRAVASAGQEIEFRTGFLLRGQDGYQPPFRVRLEIDGGHEQRNLEFPAVARPLTGEEGKETAGQVPLSFKHRFNQAGSHLVSVIVEPDPPAAQRPQEYRVKDQLPGDNRQDFALEILDVLPVLLVDGDNRPAAKTRGADFLRDALAPAIDKTPVVAVKVVPVQEFEPTLLQNDIKDPGSKPRVLILSNVARLNADQHAGVERFLAGGGGVLVTLGNRIDAKYYNDNLFGGGQGWLPAKLEDLQGDDTQAEKFVNPLPSSFFHPALELFRKAATGSLADARLPRWWKVATVAGGNSQVVASLTNQDPLLVERSYQAGRVMLSAVPLDNSWRTNLTDLPAFAPLTHELVYYLAGARSTEKNLQPGQPIIYRPDRDETPAPVTVQPPEGEAKTMPVAGWPLVYAATREPGIYRLTKADNKNLFFVVQSDIHESDLTPSGEEGRAKVEKQVPMKYEDAGPGQEAAVAPATESKQELWWWFMFGVIALLCGEVWMTRKIVKGR